MIDRTLFQLIAIPLLAAASFANVQGQTEVVSEPWPLPGTQVFGRSAAMDFTGDRRPDLVLLDGTTPVILDDPARYDAYLELSVQANDLDVMGGAVAGGGEGIFTVGPTGLVMHSYDAASETILNQNVGDTPWNGALAVRVADLDQDYRLDILGVSSDGLSVLRRDSTINDTWAPVSGFSVTEAIHGLEPIDWDGDGTDEVVLRHVGYAKVYSLTGTLLASVPLGDPDGGLTVLDSDGHAHQFLACIDATGLLVVHGPLGQVDSQDLLADEVVALAAGDLDRDGHDELIASLPENRFLIRTATPGAGGPTFTNFEYLTLGAYEAIDPNLTRVSPPLLYDLTGNGHLDISLAFEGQQNRTHHLVIRNGDLTRLQVDDPHFYSTGLTTFDATWPVLGTADGAGDESLVTHVRARAWFLPTFGYGVWPEPIEVLEPVSWGPGPGTTAVPVSLTLQPPAGAGPGDSYYIEVDPVQLTPAGDLRRAWHGTTLLAGPSTFSGGRQGISEGGEEDDIPHPPGLAGGG